MDKNFTTIRILKEDNLLLREVCDELRVHRYDLVTMISHVIQDPDIKAALKQARVELVSQGLM